LRGTRSFTGRSGRDVEGGVEWWCGWQKMGGRGLGEGGGEGLKPGRRKREFEGEG